MTVREWLTDNGANYDDRESLITACKDAMGVSRDQVTRILRSMDTSGQMANELVSGATGGFSLNGRNLLAEKPTDMWKARFYALRKGMGFTLEHLAEQWGKGIDTIRSKAKRSRS